MKGHFVSKTKDGFDWKGFQEFMGYTDEELAGVKNDPKRAQYVQDICSEEFQSKYFVCEIESTHGCVCGLEVGDRIVFKGMTQLVPEYSTGWCPYLQNTFWYTNLARNFVRNGVDPNNSYCPNSGCMDVGPENGLGRTIYKTYVLDEAGMQALLKK